MKRASRVLGFLLCACQTLAQSSAPRGLGVGGGIDSVLEPVMSDSALLPTHWGPPVSVESVVVLDAPNDGGGVLNLFWTLSLDEGLEVGTLAGYEVLRAESPEGPFASIVVLGPGTDRFQDRSARSGVSYYYIVRTRSGNGLSADSPVSAPAKSRGQWIDTRRMPVLGGLLVVLLVVLLTRALPAEQEWVLPAVRTLGDILSRKHPGSLVYVPGTGGLGNMATIASITLLEETVRLSATTETEVVIHTTDPLAHVLARDVLPDNDSIYFCPDPLVFSLAFTGETLRQRPGLGILAGALGQESLLLSESLARAGGVAVAGTDAVDQTSYLIATCDLTLIGEELMLAGPVLSAGGCRAAALVHDRLKLTAWVLILIGVAAAKLGVAWYIRLFSVGGE